MLGCCSIVPALSELTFIHASLPLDTPNAFPTTPTSEMQGIIETFLTPRHPIQIPVQSHGLAPNHFGARWTIVDQFNNGQYKVISTGTPASQFLENDILYVYSSVEFRHLGTQADGQGGFHQVYRKTATLGIAAARMEQDAQGNEQPTPWCLSHHQGSIGFEIDATPPGFIPAKSNLLGCREGLDFHVSINHVDIPDMATPSVVGFPQFGRVGFGSRLEFRWRHQAAGAASCCRFEGNPFP